MVSADTLLKHHHHNNNDTAGTTAGVQFDHDSQTWMMMSSSINNNNNTITNMTILFAKGDRIQFTVSKMHECDGTISLEGTNPLTVSLVATL